ncbi:hypothetical protein CH063_08929 [Colletotrichum higginsianum]|uniref:Uncharacterized protein n=1 Tax=Colletotrichum higginsianum (strain IMI 349063) TaxID=759273 RepID=H1VBP3_COLHI|nr:hypothetical protein CH063_08929 [Colletotrichum higginsianum]
MGDQEAAPPSPASWIAGFDFWQGFGFDAGSSSTATVTVAAGRLDRIGRLVCLGLWEDAAIAKCQPRLAVACGVVAIVEAGVQYGNGRAFIMMQHLMKLFLTVGMLLLLSILSSALPPVDVLIARTKTARAPIGASPLQVGRQCAGVCCVCGSTGVLAVGASLHLTAKSPAFSAQDSRRSRSPGRNNGQASAFVCAVSAVYAGLPGVTLWVDEEDPGLFPQ